MSRSNAAMAMPPVRYNQTRLGSLTTASGATVAGGLDLTTPSLTLQAGALRDVINFEVSQSGGYARIGGYERFDGHAAPSAATYQIVQVLIFVNTPTVGQVITQATSGATGTIIAVVSTPQYLTTEAGIPITDESGNIIYASNLCYVAVTKVTGTFDTSHAITTPGPVSVGTATPTTAVITSKQNAIYLAAAADVYRALISAVPGSGPVVGVVGMNFSGVDNVYAFRANAGNTAVAIYKASTSGWVAVPLFNTVNFTLGNGPVGATLTYEPPDGAVLTQGGVTATVQRVMWQSGVFTHGAGTAVGTLVVTNPAGGNFAAGAATLSDGTTLTLSAIQAAIVIQPGGKYEFVKYNFSGQLATYRIYGCDGVNKAFEFDGTTYAPITTGLSPDQPSHVTAHKEFLFLSQAGSISFSGAGTPFMWDAIDGGGEIATGDTVTGMLTSTGAQTTAALIIYLRSNTSILYGTDPTTFNYVSFNAGSGALPGSIQNLFDTFALDDLGVITLKTSLNYGNFSANALTSNIYPFVQQERSKVTSSSVMREKSQYRVFFSDGYGLWLTVVNQSYLGAGVVQFPNPVNCIDVADISTGGTKSYYGSTDSLGFVYQLDIGTSFDGASISAYIKTAWDPIKSPRILKRFRAASIEIQGEAYAEIQFGYQLSYGTPNIGQPSYVTYPTGFVAAPMWDSFAWDAFTWDGQTLAPTDVDMTGTGNNLQVIIASNSNYVAPFNVNSVISHYTMRRGERV